MPVASAEKWQGFIDAARARGASPGFLAMLASGTVRHLDEDGVTWEAPGPMVPPEMATKSALAQADGRARWRGKTWSELSLCELVELAQEDRDLFDRLYADHDD